MSNEFICTTSEELISAVEQFEDAYKSLNTPADTIDLIKKNKRQAVLKTLSHLLRTNTVLFSLDLSANDLEAEDIRELCEALSTNTSLTNLSLYSNDIRDKGAAYVAKALEINNALQDLNLGKNELEDEAAGYIAEALKRNNQLVSLDLRNNFIGDKGAFQIADALKVNRHLAKLDLGVNYISNDSAMRFAEVLYENKSLSNFFLYGNKIGDEGIHALMKVTQVNKRLLQLSLTDNKGTIPQQLINIQESLDRNHTDLFTYNQPEEVEDDSIVMTREQYQQWDQRMQAYYEEQVVKERELKAEIKSWETKYYELAKEYEDFLTETRLKEQESIKELSRPVYRESGVWAWGTQLAVFAAGGALVYFWASKKP